MGFLVAQREDAHEIYLAEIGQHADRPRQRVVVEFGGRTLRIARRLGDVQDRRCVDPRQRDLAVEALRGLRRQLVLRIGIGVVALRLVAAALPVARPRQADRPRHPGLQLLEMRQRHRRPVQVAKRDPAGEEFGFRELRPCRKPRVVDHVIGGLVVAARHQAAHDKVRLGPPACRMLDREDLERAPLQQRSRRDVVAAAPRRARPVEQEVRIIRQ